MLRLAVNLDWTTGGGNFDLAGIGSGGHCGHISRTSSLNQRLPGVNPKVAGFNRIRRYPVFTVSSLVGGHESGVFWGVSRLVVVPGGVVAGDILSTDATDFFFGNAHGNHGQRFGGEASIFELFEEGHIAVTVQRVKDRIGFGFLNLADNRAKFRATQRDILFTGQRHAGIFQLRLDDQVGGAGEDIVRTKQVNILGTQFVD